jgi:hypothetical protein
MHWLQLVRHPQLPLPHPQLLQHLPQHQRLLPHQWLAQHHALLLGLETKSLRCQRFVK